MSVQNKWIKFEKALTTDPKVLRIGSRLRNAGVTLESLYTLAALGALTRFWSFADSHIRDDNTLPSSIAEINEVIGIANFCDLLPTEWFQILDSERVHLPDFLEHNGIKARRRALGAERQSRFRQSRNGSVTKKSRKSDARVTPSALPKTSDLKTSQESPIDPPLPKKARKLKSDQGTRLPDDWPLTPQLRDFGESLGVQNVPRVFEDFCDYWHAKPGALALKLDWPKTWYRWCRNQLDQPPLRNGHHPGPPAVQRDTATWAEARHLAKAIGFRPPLEHESATAYQADVKRAALTPAKVPEALRLGLAGLTGRLTR